MQYAILIDPAHFYTAGERHGRAYRYEVMAKNFKGIALLATTEEASYDVQILQSDFRLSGDLASFPSRGILEPVEVVNGVMRLCTALFKI